MRFVHDLIAGRAADAPALIDHDGARHTYGEFAQMVVTLADALGDAGLRAGDRLLLVSENSATYAAGILAASRIGAWVSPVNARHSADELDAIAAHAGARMLMFTPEASAASADHAARLAAKDHGALACGRILTTDAAPSEPEPMPDHPAERVAALMYTTGTTSAPKGVMLTHRNLTWNAESSARLRKMNADDEAVLVLPGTHIFGFASVFLASLHAGCTIRFLPRFSPAAVLAAIADGVSVMSAVPQMYAALLRHLKAEGVRPVAPRLRYISAGGAPLDPEWKIRIEEAFGLPLNNGYGLTETSPGVSGTWQDAPRTDTSVGYALPDVELKIHEPDDHGVGELWIRGPGVMKGYYRDPARTAEVLTPDGWFRSGDLSRIDPDGALHIVGRLKELIIRSGFNVHPPEVEAWLTRHPAVSQAAVVGRMVPGNEEILAFCLTDGSAGEDELKGWLREHLAHYKVPQHILLVDHYPVAPTGKILKHRLVAHFAPLLAERDAATAPS